MHDLVVDYMVPLRQRGAALVEDAVGPRLNDQVAHRRRRPEIGGGQPDPAATVLGEQAAQRHRIKGRQDSEVTDQLDAPDANLVLAPYTFHDSPPRRPAAPHAAVLAGSYGLR